MEGNIKTIVPTTCPNCQHDIMVEFAMAPTVLGDVFTMEQMKDAKQELLRKIKDMDLPKEQHAQVVEWITSEDTIFGPSEVPTIIKSLLEAK